MTHHQLLRLVGKIDCKAKARLEESSTHSRSNDDGIPNRVGPKTIHPTRPE
jgi:hypothetical protein